ISLVRARQSNFAISTPTAVAAVRGTVYVVIYDAVQNVMQVAVLVKDPRRATGIVSCSSFFDRFSTVLVREGLATIVSGTAGGSPRLVPTSSLPDASLVGTLQTPTPPGPAFSAPVTPPSIPEEPIGPPVVFIGEPLSAAPPSTIGQDIGQLPPSQQAASSPP